MQLAIGVETISLLFLLRSPRFFLRSRVTHVPVCCPLSRLCDDAIRSQLRSLRNRFPLSHPRAPSRARIRSKRSKRSILIVGRPRYTHRAFTTNARHRSFLSKFASLSRLYVFPFLCYSRERPRTALLCEREKERRLAIARGCWMVAG